MGVPIGPGSLDSSTPTDILPGQYSITNYDSSTGNLFYSLTFPTAGTVRVDAMLSNVAGVRDSTGPSVEIISYSMYAVPGSPSLFYATDDRYVERRSFDDYPYPVLIELDPAAFVGYTNYATLHEVWTQEWQDSYPVYEDFEALVIQYFGSAETYLAALNSTPQAIDGELQVVLRVSEVSTEVDPTPIPLSSGMETFETLVVGQVSDSTPGEYDTYINGDLSISTVSTYSLAVDTYRSHGGSKALRKASPELLNAGWIGPTVELVSVGQRASSSRSKARASHWAHFNGAYPYTDLWHINDYWAGWHATISPGALDYGFSLNGNGRGDGRGPAAGYSLATIHFFLEREVNSSNGEWIDTGINAWDVWLKYVIDVDFDLDTFKVSIENETTELWSYTTSLTNVGTDDGVAFDATSVSFRTSANRVNQTGAASPVAPSEFMDWYDDFEWQYWKRNPVPPLLYEIVLDEISVTVTRQWPRDDGHGMSSAPRAFPPPKRSQRIVGGYL